MNVFFEDDGQLKAGTRPRRQRHVAAGRGRVRQAPEDQGGARCCCASPRPSPSALHRRGAASSPPSSTRLPVGGLRRRRVRLRRARARVLRPRAGAGARPPRSRCALPRAPMYFYKRGKGRYRKAPPDALKAALASVERKKREARADRRRGSPSSARGRLPDALRGEAADAAATSRTRTRSSGRRSRPRATRSRRTRSRCSPRAARFRRRTSTTSTRSSRRRFRRGTAFPPWGSAAAAARTAGRAGARVLDRRRDDDRDRRRVLGARAARRQLRGRHPHRRAGARRSPRGSAARRASRARGCRPSTCPGASSRCCPTRSSRAFTLAAGADAAGAVARTSRSTHDGAPLRHETRVERVPVAANLRLDAVGEAFANDAAVAGRPAVDRRAARAVEARARTSPPRAARPTSRASTTASTSTGTPAPRRAGWRSCRGRAARRSTSSSPS